MESSGTRGVILHVEDDDSEREAMGALLRVESFEIHQAADGGSVRKLAGGLRGRLDVLIVDYNLGRGISGTEVAEGMCRLVGHPVPTIMLTGDTANCEIPVISDAPVWVARKPMDPRTLLATLPALVQFRRELARVVNQR